MNCGRNFVLTLAALTAWNAANAETLLTENGEPRAVILVETDQPKSQRAATELQKYIRLMSGAELPLIAEGEPLPANPGTTVLIGHTDRAKKLGVRIPSGYDPTPRPDVFEEEGFVLKTIKNEVAAAGNNDGPYHGTEYAVYALLCSLGCRWYFPGDWGEIIPKRATIKLENLDLREKPDFAQRSVSLGGWLPVSREERAEYNEWKLRVGMTVDRVYPVAGDGFLATLVNPNEYYKDHPEWYAMNQAGERHLHPRANGTYYDRHTMLCLSNEEMFAEAVKNAKLAFAGEKKMSIVGSNGLDISPPDGVPYCYCENCKAQSQNFNYPGYAHRTFQSEEFFGFAAKLAHEFPDKFVATMAYSLREIVPQGVDLPKNVSVMVAPISCDVLHPNDSKLWRRRDFVRNLRRWRAKSDHITIYDYNPGLLLGSWVPERDAENFAINAPIYREIGIKGFNSEGRKAFMQTWISYYVRARFLWDADSDLEAIKADFYPTFFGKQAGPHIRAWWDACSEALVRDPMQAHEDWLINHIYTQEFVRSIQKHIDAAKAAESTPEQKQRIDAVALIADHLLAFSEMNDAERNTDYAKAAAAAERMYQREVELHEIYQYFHEYRNEDHGRRSYFPGGRSVHFKELAAKTNGESGVLVAPIPLEASFARDPFNEGIVGGWQDVDFDDSAWETRDTYITWDQQEEPLDEAGHDYDGYGWYRFSFDLPADLKGKSVSIYCGGIINEGWLWANGKYAGHKPHEIWWNSLKHPFEVDVTGQVEFGKKNTIAIRVWNDAEIGGLYRRGFIWAGDLPKSGE